MFEWFSTRFQEFDVYSKPHEEFRIKTSLGGLVTVVSFTVIILLAISETFAYLRVEVAEELIVDSTSAELRVEIFFDITFSRLPCAFLSIDVMDVTGRSQHDVSNDVFKLRLNENGDNITGAQPIRQNINVNSSNAMATTKETLCGSCYGAAEGCCNTCEDVKTAYEIRGWTIDNIVTIEQCRNDDFVKELKEHENEGCRVYGHVEVAKCEGNFHIAPGVALSSHRQHFHDLHSVSPGTFNTSHTVNALSFGRPYPNKIYPLNGKTFLSSKGGIMHQYFVKVVPTMYVYAITRAIADEEFSYQFSVTRSQRDVMAGASGLPGFFVQYSFSPLMVKYEERRQPLSQFLVSLAAIVGGIYAMAGLVDSFIYTSSRALQRKIAANKLT